MFPKKILGIPVGWKDKGGDVFNKRGYYASHTYCSHHIKVGVEDGVAFKFCPKCEKKLEENEIE